MLTPPLESLNALPEGLDELIERIEETFRIDLPSYELVDVRTVGDLYAVILGKLETADTSRPGQAFFRLRKAMMAALGLPRKAIRPATKLAVLLPEAKRIAAWKQLEVATGLTFPKLRHPRWARDVIRSLALIAAIATQWLMADWTHPRGIFWLPLEVTVVVAFIVARQALYAATGFLAKGLPERSVGELAKTLLQTNYAQFIPETGEPITFTRKEAWERLVYLIGAVLGVQTSQVGPETYIDESLRIPK
jgi:hypothetical protein